MAPTRKKRLLLLCGASLLTLQLIAVPIDFNHVAKGQHRAQAQESCFTAGTLILMADGTRQPIEVVRDGDLVAGRRGRINHVLRCERTKLGARRLYALNGGRPFVTAEHPFLTADGWKAFDPDATRRENPRLSIAALQLGDRLCRGALHVVGGERRALFVQHSTVLEAVSAIDGDPNTPLFNLLLDGDHSYVADGWIVHNKEGDGGGADTGGAGDAGGGAADGGAGTGDDGGTGDSGGSDGDGGHGGGDSDSGGDGGGSGGGGDGGHSGGDGGGGASGGGGSGGDGGHGGGDGDSGGDGGGGGSGGAGNGGASGGGGTGDHGSDGASGGGGSDGGHASGAAAGAGSAAGTAGASASRASASERGSPGGAAATSAARSEARPGAAVAAHVSAPAAVASPPARSTIGGFLEGIGIGQPREAGLQPKGAPLTRDQERTLIKDRWRRRD